MTILNGGIYYERNRGKKYYTNGNITIKENDYEK